VSYSRICDDANKKFYSNNSSEKSTFSRFVISMFSLSSELPLSECNVIKINLYST